MPGRPAVRLLNPTVAEDGWAREATVVQVVTDDMPYLVDSIAAEFARDGVQVQRIVHPIVVVSRDLTGELQEVHPDADPADPPANSAAESWMYIEIDFVTDPNRARELDNRLSSVLGDVREVVEDAEKMAQTACQLASELETEPPHLPQAEVAEGARLLRWLADGHFTFLGYRRYELVDNPHPDSDEPALRAVLASGLGVLRQDSLAARGLTAGPDTAASALAPTLLVLTQASAPSTVHRPVYPYYVGVKTFDAEGNVTGEHRFLGMFTTTALHENVLDIPVVCNRVREVIHRAGFPMESYSGQRMLEVLQNWPRADLFSADTDSLYSTTHRRDRAVRPPPAAAVPAPRPVRPLLLLPRLPPAGPLHDAVAAGDAGGPARRARRHPARVQRADRRDRAGAGALHGAHRSARAGWSRTRRRSRTG